MKIIYVSLALLLASLAAHSDPIKNQKLLKVLKSSSRWVLLPLVEDSEKGSTLSKHSKSWIYEKEAELQDLDLEIITLSRSEQKQALAWWTKPFTSRLNKNLTQLCQDLNCNLLTAYHDPSDSESFTYVVYSLEKKKQLVFRAPQTKTQTATKSIAAKKEGKKTAPIKTVKVTPKPEPKKVVQTTTVSKQETNPTVAHSTPDPVKTQPNKESSFSEDVQAWFNIKEKPPVTRESYTTDNRRRRRNSDHPEAKQKIQAELHENLMNNKKLSQYAKSEQSKGQQHVEQTCLEHLKQADESWMASSKFEHLSRAYVLNQHLSSPNSELKTHLINELYERKQFLNDWDSDVSK